MWDVHGTAQGTHLQLAAVRCKGGGEAMLHEDSGSQCAANICSGHSMCHDRWMWTGTAPWSFVVSHSVGQVCDASLVIPHASLVRA